MTRAQKRKRDEIVVWLRENAREFTILWNAELNVANNNIYEPQRCVGHIVTDCSVGTELGKENLNPKKCIMLVTRLEDSPSIAIRLDAGDGVCRATINPPGQPE